MHNGCYFLWVSRHHTAWLGTKSYSSSPCIVSTYLARVWYTEISIMFPPWLNNEWSLPRQHLNNFQLCISSIKHKVRHGGILHECFRGESVNERIEGWLERDSLTFIQPERLTCVLPSFSPGVTMTTNIWAANVLPEIRNKIPGEEVSLAETQQTQQQLTGGSQHRLKWKPDSS